MARPSEPKIALAYRLARAQVGREDRHWLIGASVTQTGLRVTLGGRFAWIDVDGSGIFSPGIDGVDYTPTTPAWKKYNDTSNFVVGVDWLYQDENGNGVRDFGTVFGETKPGFGEALFVVDDVNENEVLDIGESLVRLGSSKVKGVLDFQTGIAKEFTRGINLTQFTAPVSEQLHGSMVLGTIAGGDANFTRFQGLAPDAELLLAYRYGASSLLDSLVWAQQKNAQIALWEMATWYYEPLDGSSDLEAACDAAHQGGMLQIGAAGNLGGSKKHIVFTAPTGSSSSTLVIPAKDSAGVGGNFKMSASTTATLSFTLGARRSRWSGPRARPRWGPSPCSGSPRRLFATPRCAASTSPPPTSFR